MVGVSILDWPRVIRRRLRSKPLCATEDSIGQRSYAILGTVGVPGAYGGFETLAENLVHFHSDTRHSAQLAVYCSAKASPERPSRFRSAVLRFIPLNANGPQSIPYDILSLASAVRHRTDVILLLGVSGALALPLVRLVSRARIVTNIDGIEWKREKWTGLAKWVLRWSERAAVRWSHHVIADNQAISDYVWSIYGSPCHVIAYGGDHAVAAPPAPVDLGLTDAFALALCRIEPENNVEMILKAYSQMPERPLVFVGNWNKSEYGRRLRAKFEEVSNISLRDPIYDPGQLRHLRGRAKLYVHGHSAGGTNPSLVEMMHFGVPVLAHGCAFNRYTTEGKAHYFETPEELVNEVRAMTPKISAATGSSMREIAQRRYTWDLIGEAYFALLENA